MKTSKRKAEIGEKILIVRTERLHESRLNEIYTVESRLGNIVNVREIPWAVMDYEYEVIESE